MPESTYTLEDLQDDLERYAEDEDPIALKVVIAVPEGDFSKPVLYNISSVDRNEDKLLLILSEEPYVDGS